METGDVFLTDWDSLLGGVEAVVSTLGMFGPNDQMERINAEANILALTAAKKAGECTTTCSSICLNLLCQYIVFRLSTLTSMRFIPHLMRIHFNVNKSEQCYEYYART